MPGFLSRIRAKDDAVNSEISNNDYLHISLIDFQTI